ncbi:MAG: hypothetical protein EBX41_03775 [Chitinophagia bacterium]|nr:hypothetical protein [Chitinophagia bacterium]
MRYTAYGLVFIVLVAWALVLGGCTRERLPCLTPKIGILRLQCVHFTADTATIARDSSLPQSLWIAAATGGYKGTLYGSSSAFTLSLSAVADSAQWLFTPDTATLRYIPMDTLTFYYNRRRQFISNACGFACFYTLNKIATTHHHTDSVVLLNPDVTNDVSKKHIKIYIHPAF